MDFKMGLLNVEKALRLDEVKALAFLCSDLLERNLTSVKSALELFRYLRDGDLLSAEQPDLLNELLLIIHRPRLARDLRLHFNPSNLISPYRKLLYNVSEELTDENLRHMKFLLNTKLPRRKLEENTTALEIFQEMEHKDLINETDLNLLETLLQQCCPMLIEEINKFREQQVLPRGPVAQETGRLRSASNPEPYQGPGFVLPGGSELSVSRPVAQSTMSSSNTSLDMANVAHAVNELQPPSLKMTGLSTKSTSCSSLKESTFRTDQPQMNRNFDKQAAEITNTEFTEIYPMTAAKRGFCLIINNHNFENSPKSLSNRDGTNADQESLIKVFEWLGFELEIKKDCSRDEILSGIKELGKKDHSDRDCVVCFILSHGEEEGVLGVDGLPVSLQELKEPLTGLNCPSLVNKPKLFFIQACQGTKSQKAVYVEADGPDEGNITSDARRESIPTGADFLLAMATVPYHVSYRGRITGTWFIQSLCQNLVQMVPSGRSLMSILIKVNADVSRKTDGTGQKKQMPQPTFTLRKNVVFPKPQAPPPNLQTSNTS